MPKRWRRDLRTYRDRIDHANWYMAQRNLPPWVFPALFVLVFWFFGSATWAYLGISEQLLEIRSRAFPLYADTPIWFLIGGFGFGLAIPAYLLAEYFFPERRRLVLILCGLICAASLSYAGYLSYRVEVDLVRYGWIACRKATSEHPVRTARVFALEPEWCPRTRDKIP